MSGRRGYITVAFLSLALIFFVGRAVADSMKLEDKQPSPDIHPAVIASASSARHHGLSISVRGNALINQNQQVIQLKGLNRSGTEYECVKNLGIFDGPSSAASIAVMKTWRINSVRVPLNEDCWLGINNVSSKYSGQNYRAAVEAYVSKLNAAGLYAILDVHWSATGSREATGQDNMLDADHGIKLWTSIAQTFKSNPAVLFDLFNEPHDLQSLNGSEWPCWANDCAGYTGMNQLVQAVRSTGAHNVVLLAGLGWASDVSEWAQFVPNDPLHQEAVSFHVYGGHSLCTTADCWTQTLLPLARSYPVIVSEFGEMQCGAPSSIAWLNQFMNFAYNNHLSMLAWTWDNWQGDCAGGPTLITNYSGSPTPYGAAVKAFYRSH